MIHDRHPTIVIVFILILVISECLYLPRAWSRMGLFARSAAVLAVLMPYLMLYLACAADPGYITPENHAYHMSLYPYDHAIYHPGHHCRTCGFLKPPRSKHCSVCKRCVAKADHHCVFINSCVGHGNQHWFLLLLVATGVLTSYGGILGLSILARDIARRYPHWSVYPPANLSMTQYLAIWTWGLHADVRLGATSLLAILTTPLVWGLTIYSFYLVWCGTTTNESLKWSDWIDDMSEGFAFRRPLPATRPRDASIEALETRWPVEPQHILLATTDGKPPEARLNLPGEGDWEQVWGLRDVENLYDLGFGENLADIFIKDYDFGETAGELPVERRWQSKGKRKSRKKK